MADFADLIAQAQPALAIVEAEVTEGKSWAFGLALEDADGAPVDLSGLSAECKVLESIDGDTVAEFDVTLGADGSLSWVCDPPATNDTAGTSSDRKRPCPWYLTLTDGTDSVAVFNVQESRLIIHQGE